MGDPARHGRAVFIVAVSSRHDAAFAWARERAQAEYGPIARSSPRFDFRETDYYDQTMGPGLYKEFWTFVRPFDPEDLPTNFAAPELGITRWGTLKLDWKSMATTLDGVFAAGDIVRGASLVVWAIKDGRDAAEGIDRYIQAKASRTAPAVAAE